MVIAFCIAMAIMVYSVKSFWVALLGLLLLSGVVLTVALRLIGFADRNPQAALFEGAELLAHEQLHVGSKHQPIISVDPSDRSSPRKIEKTEDEISAFQAQEDANAPKPSDKKDKVGG